jgi:hypothetical protein
MLNIKNIPPHIGYYLAGFTDGEGSFNISFRPRPDGVWYYEVNNLTAIVENVIPFFEQFGFLSAKKKRDFQTFKRIVSMIRNDDHLTIQGITEILKLRNEMNDGGKRKYLDEEILKACGESSETIRRIPKDDVGGMI